MTICLGIDTILWEQAKKDNPDPKKWVRNLVFNYSLLLRISSGMFSFMTKGNELFIV